MEDLAPSLAALCKKLRSKVEKPSFVTALCNAYVVNHFGVAFVSFST